MKGGNIARADHPATSSSFEPRRTFPAAMPRFVRLGRGLAPAALAFAAGTMMLDAAALAPLSHHMSTHILLMNLVAPLVALAMTQDGLPTARLASGPVLAAATVAQLAVLWATHSPAVLASAMKGPAVALAVQAMLAGSALWFWLAVLAQRGVSRWRALLALLVTGKLFCLLAVLLIFAPREIYPAMAHGAGHAAAPAMSDQHLAGLLMMTACPLTYVLAAVVITARWLKEIARQDAAPAERSL
jgi:putative membrane protein